MQNDIYFVSSHSNTQTIAYEIQQNIDKKPSMCYGSSGRNTKLYILYE